MSGGKSYINHFVKCCDRAIKIVLFIAVICNISEVFAETISANTTLSTATIYSENVTLSKDITLTINSDVTIKGNLISNGGIIVIGAGGKLTVDGAVTINDKTDWRLIDETAKLIVKGDVTVNEDKELKINDGGGPGIESTYSGVVIVQGSMSVGKKAKTHINHNATVIIEGDLVLAAGNNGNNNDAEIHVDHSACVTIKKQISGRGRIKIMMPDGGPEGNNGYIAVLGYDDDGQSVGNGLGIDQNKITLEVGHELQQENDFLYIEGVSSLDGITTNNQGVNSAYDQAMEALASARAAGLLPIELNFFTATATKYGYAFKWETNSEVNNDYFTLEYSINGVNFNKIDYVHGAGTTSATSEYEYRWNDAPDFEMIYFRLKQIDYNGEYSYSNVIVSCRKKSAGATKTLRYGPLTLQVVDGELRYITK